MGPQEKESGKRDNFFSASYQSTDRDVFHAVQQELLRQQSQIELIASENIVSRGVLEAQGSVLTNKYAEGYSGKRYYGGCEYVDLVEDLAIERAKKLFGCAHANVQPHSGSQANGAVYLALLKPGDTILGMSLPSGGHLTHGAKPSISGKWFRAVGYDVRPDDFLIDYDQLESLAIKNKPQLIIAGASAYSRIFDFKAFRQIADKVGAYFMVDMAHIAGLVATGVHPDPFPYAHVVTSTTHKTLRGPRGGLLLTNDDDLAKKLKSAVFPGLQGGPLMHVIAAKAVAFKEALDPSFKNYIQQVVKNAQILANVLKQGGVDIVSGKTENHLMLVDLRPKQLKGAQVEKVLESVGLTCNKNSIPFDMESPMITSGLRLGTPAVTTRGFEDKEIKKVGELILTVVDALQGKEALKEDVFQNIRKEVKILCDRFPIYGTRECS